jgi:uncharacterized protein
MSPILIICSAALGLLTFALGFNVSLARNRLKDGHSFGNDPAGPLMKAVRAHANAAEYIGVIIGLFVVTALVYAGRDLGIAMTVIVIGITLARFSHAIGMLTCKTLETANPFRFAGALGTYLFGFALSGMLIAKAVF